MARVIASGSALLELQVVGETGTLSYGGVCGGGVLRSYVDEKNEKRVCLGQRAWAGYKVSMGEKRGHINTFYNKDFKINKKIRGYGK